jgi:hypothetical protein
MPRKRAALSDRESPADAMRQHAPQLPEGLERFFDGARQAFRDAFCVYKKELADGRCEDQAVAAATSVFDAGCAHASRFLPSSWVTREEYEELPERDFIKELESSPPSYSMFRTTFFGQKIVAVVTPNGYGALYKLSAEHHFN